MDRLITLYHGCPHSLPRADRLGDFRGDLVTPSARLTSVIGDIAWDATKRDGQQPRRMHDASRAARAFGFAAGASFEDGLRRSIEWYPETGRPA